MIRVISLNERPQIPEKVPQGSMLDLEGGACCEKQVPEGAVTIDPDRIETDPRALPFHDRNFREVKATDLPYALLKGERLKSVLSEFFRVLEPGGEVRIDTEVGVENPDGGRADSHCIKSHWLNEAPASCRAMSDESELRERLDEAGFEEMQIWKEPSPAPYLKLTLIAVKPR